MTRRRAALSAVASIYSMEILYFMTRMSAHVPYADNIKAYEPNFRTTPLSTPYIFIIICTHYTTLPIKAQIDVSFGVLPSHYSSTILHVLTNRVRT